MHMWQYDVIEENSSFVIRVHKAFTSYVTRTIGANEYKIVIFTEIESNQESILERA